MGRQVTSPDWISRFWAKVDKGPDNDTCCWNWTAAVFKSKDRPLFAYGAFGRRTHGCRSFVATGETAAHRVSWVLANGKEIPFRGMILHKCNNPRCVRPDHLRLGTALENMKDRRDSGRFNWVQRSYILVTDRGYFQHD